MNKIFKTLAKTASTKQSNPRRSFKQLIRLGDSHALKYNGKFCSLTMNRGGNKVEIQTFDFDGLQERNHSEPFMVNMNELK